LIQSALVRKRRRWSDFAVCDSLKIPARPSALIRGDTMKVVVDLQLCEGNARCMEAAPEVFDVGDDDKARLLNANPPESLREKLKLAVRMCPRQAIALKED